MKFRSLVAAGVAASAFLAPAAANAADTHVTINGDTAAGLTFVSPPSFGDFDDVTLGTTTQTSTADINAFSVKDTRGTLAGWHVNIKATPFTNDADSTYKLDPGSLKISALPTLSPLSPLSPLLNALTKPTVAIGTGTAIDDGSDHLWVSAPLNLTSSGQWDASAAPDGLTVSVPPAAKAGAYTSTITTTLATGIS